MRIAYYGGSFNPPHYGHFLVASWALCGGFVDQVWMVPCYQHAFGKALAPYEDRITMCELGAAGIGERLVVSRIEEELGGPKYTIDAIKATTQRFPEHEFRLLVGTDILNETDQWKSFEELKTLAPLLVAPRGGYEHGNELGFQIPEVASHVVRERLTKALDVTPAIPPPVAAYIRDKALYTTPT